MKVAIASSSDLAIPLISAIAQEHTISYCISTPDKPQKRSGSPAPNSFSEKVEGYEVFKPESSAQLLDILQRKPVDIVVTLAYGKLISKEALSSPPHGWLNIHFSLLPQWRGASPVQSSLIAGEESGGFSIFKLDEGLDTGPIFLKQSYTYDSSARSGSILRELAAQAASSINKVLQDIEIGVEPTPQHNESSTHAGKFATTDGALETSMDITEAFNRYRALSDNPGVYIEVKGVRVKIIEARVEYDNNCLPGTIKVNKNHLMVGFQGGYLDLCSIIPAGKKQMLGADYARGARLVDGEHI